MLSIPLKASVASHPEKPGFFELVVCLVILFCCVGSPPPGVNESHYLPKAKSIWDAGYASGGDLFLTSGNAHWLASAMAGLAARQLELSSVAWLGRVIAWSFLAFAWIRLCQAVAIPVLMRPICLLAWFLLSHYGNWAGEWFAGGFEAKALAYPCVLMGLSNAFSNRWQSAWIWLGAAAAWHPVVGGWAGLTVAIRWLLGPHRWQRLKGEVIGLGFGILLCLVGVVPALSGIGASDQVDGISAAQVHVYYRLPHHLSPQAFAPERHMAAVAVLAWLVIVTLLSRDGSGALRKPRPVDSILIVAWLSVAISLVGLVVDLSVRIGFRHDVAAKLLRFYFFRWSDIVVPLAVVVTLANYLAPPSPIKERDSGELTWHQGLRIVFIYFLVGAIGIWHWAELMRAPVPPADVSLIRSVGPFELTSENLKPDSFESEESDWEAPLPLLPQLPERYIDWLAVCEWIRDNTPADSLWFTPRYQQTFKWYTARAEVVNWKDVPQDNHSIIEWYRRIERCKPPRDNEGKHRGWTTEELIDLAKLYRFQWVLIDRSFQETPPLLECKYPLFIDNRSFAVFHIPSTLIQQTESDLPAD